MQGSADNRKQHRPRSCLRSHCIQNHNPNFGPGKNSYGSSRRRSVGPLATCLAEISKKLLGPPSCQWGSRGGGFRFSSLTSTFPSPSGKPGEATGGVFIVKKCLSNKAFSFFSCVLPFVFNAAASPPARSSSTFWSAFFLASSLSALSFFKRFSSASRVSRFIFCSFLIFCRFACSLSA
jgi:hypothetical protein